MTALEVKTMEMEEQILQCKITTEIMSDKEKSLVEEIQVNQAVILKLQNHPFFLFAFLHLQT